MADDKQSSATPARHDPNPGGEGDGSRDPDHGQAQDSEPQSTQNPEDESHPSEGSGSRFRRPPPRRARKAVSSAWSRRRPLFALISLFLPGFGQIMGRRYTLGLLFALQFLVSAGLFHLFMGMDWIGGSWSFLMVGLAFLSMIVAQLNSAFRTLVSRQRPKHATLSPNDWHLFGLITLSHVVLSIVTPGYRVAVVPDDSMRPGLNAGDVVVLRNAVGTVRRGDVVRVSTELGDYQPQIRRVVGLERENIRVADEQVFIGENPLVRVYSTDTTIPGFDGPIPARMYWERVAERDRRLQYRTIETSKRSPYDNTRGFFVPPDHYFVMADNRDNGIDSRSTTEFGFVNDTDITGRPLFVLLPAGLLDWSRYGLSAVHRSRSDAQ